MVEYAVIFGLIILGFLLIVVEWKTRENLAEEVFRLGKIVHQLGGKLGYYYRNDWAKRKET